MRPYPWVPLKRFCRIVGGATPASDERFWGGGVPWYTPTDVSAVHGGALAEPSRTLTAEGLESCSASMTPPGTVVLTTRAPIGNVALTDRPSTTNQGCKSLVPSAGTDPRFVAYAAQALLPELRAAGTGTTFQEISGERLGGVRFPRPRAEQQAGIADLLDRECDRIDVAAERIRAVLDLGRLLPERVYESHPVVLAAERVRLRFSLDSIEQGWSPECEARLASPGGWGVTKAGAANYGRFRPEEHKALPVDLEPRRQHELRLGDVVMSRANTRELAGSAARVEDLAGWHLILCDKLYRLQLRRDRLDADFAVCALNSREARAQIEASTSGASASMQNISQEIVRGLMLPRPGLPDQREVVAATRASRSRVEQATAVGERSLAALVGYRDSLIHEAVTGKLQIDVSEAEMDERAVAAAEGRLDEVRA